MGRNSHVLIIMKVVPGGITASCSLSHPGIPNNQQNESNFSREKRLLPPVLLPADSMCRWKKRRKKKEHMKATLLGSWQGRSKYEKKKKNILRC